MHASNKIPNRPASLASTECMKSEHAYREHDVRTCIQIALSQNVCTDYKKSVVCTESMKPEHVYGVHEVRMQWKHRFKNLRDRFVHLGDQVLAS